MHEALLEIYKDEVEAMLEEKFENLRVRNIVSIMDSFSCSMKKAMEALEVPAEKRDWIVAKVKAALAEKTEQDQNAG